MASAHTHTHTHTIPKKPSQKFLILLKKFSTTCIVNNVDISENYFRRDQIPLTQLTACAIMRFT